MINEHPEIKCYVPYRVTFKEPVNLRIQRGGKPKPITEVTVVFFRDEFGQLFYKSPNASVGYRFSAGQTTTLASSGEKVCFKCAMQSLEMVP